MSIQNFKLKFFWVLALCAIFISGSPSKASSQEGMASNYQKAERNLEKQYEVKHQAEGAHGATFASDLSKTKDSDQRLYNSEVWGGGTVEKDFTFMKDECKGTAGVYMLNGAVKCGHSDVIKHPDAVKIQSPSQLLSLNQSSTANPQALASIKEELGKASQKLKSASNAYGVAAASGDYEALQNANKVLTSAESKYLGLINAGKAVGLPQSQDFDSVKDHYEKQRVERYKSMHDTRRSEYGNNKSDLEAEGKDKKFAHENNPFR